MNDFDIKIEIDNRFKPPVYYVSKTKNGRNWTSISFYDLIELQKLKEVLDTFLDKS